METKESKIMEIQDRKIIVECPEGYTIDKENSTFECIKFKPIKKRWRDDEKQRVSGFYIDCETSSIEGLRYKVPYNPFNYSIFATQKQAKSALAMARISQIMANDERFGGVVTDEEWKNTDTLKHVILRSNNEISIYAIYTYNFLAFHTAEQRDLFLKENEDLVRDYLMLD